MTDRPPVFQIGDRKTLPLYLFRARVESEIPAFGKGEGWIEYPTPVVLDGALLESICPASSNSAMTPMRPSSSSKDGGCTSRSSSITPKSQDDPDRSKVRSLHDHTEVISTLCDARLGIDTTELWTAFDRALHFEMVHWEYREDPNREGKYQEYAKKLEDAWERLAPHTMSTGRLIDRIVKQIELKRSAWPKLPPIVQSPVDEYPVASDGSRKLRVFYSYSHRDETLRDQLENPSRPPQEDRALSKGGMTERLVRVTNGRTPSTRTLRGLTSSCSWSVPTSSPRPTASTLK